MFMTSDTEEYKFMGGKDEHNFGHGLDFLNLELRREMLLKEVDIERSEKG